MVKVDFDIEGAPTDAITCWRCEAPPPVAIWPSTAPRLIVQSLCLVLVVTRGEDGIEKIVRHFAHFACIMHAKPALYVSPSSIHWLQHV